MKIGLVIYESLDILSGGYLYDRKLVENLTALGDEVTILPLKWRAYPLCLLDNYSSKLQNELISQDFDVLLQDELAHPSLFQINKLIRQSRNIPIVGIIHHLRINENHPALWMRLYKRVEKRYLNSLDGMICNSITTRQTVDQITERRLPAIVAYPAVDHFELESDQEAIRVTPAALPLRLLFVGNIIPRKGLHTLNRGSGKNTRRKLVPDSRRIAGI
ncbi:MAG: glycosyltransferase [Anaerolineaceae bacterium]